MSTNPTPWDESFEKLIRKAVPLLGDEPLTCETELRNYGLDSMASVQLLLETEEQYAISVPDDLMEPTMFDTPGTLWAIVEKLLSPANA